MLRVKGTDNEIALCSSRIGQNLIDVRILSGIPGMHVDRHALFLQTVAGHEHATVVLCHATTVAVDIVQRQHHPKPDSPFADVVDSLCLLRIATGLGRLLCLGCLKFGLGIGDPQHGILPQLVVRRVHLRIGLDQLLNGNTVHPGDAEDGFLLLYLMLTANLRLLGRHNPRRKGQQRQQQNIS